MTEISTIVSGQQIEPSKAEAILGHFTEFFDAARKWENTARDIVVTSEDQIDKMQNAREARLQLKAIRVNVENTRKELKEQSLREGKAIDGVANVIKSVIVPLEDHLWAQEKFADVLAEKRASEMISQRREKLLSVGANPDLYNIGVDVSDDVFNSLVRELESAAKIQAEAARKAEAEAAERAAAEEERVKNIQAENERLLAERKKRDAEIAEARAEAEKAQAELRAKAESEAREKYRAEAAAHLAEVAPDKEKLIAYAERLKNFAAPAGVTDMSEQAREIVSRTERALLTLSQKVAEAASRL